jgi:hypothetical protein
LDELRDPVKQTKLKQPKNRIKLSPKPTPRNKRNRTRKNIGREDTCKVKITWLTWEMRLVGR